MHIEAPHHDFLAGYVADEHIGHSSVSILGAGLLDSQGGDITSTRTFTLNNSDIDHGSISGLSDDDHTQYLLINGTRAMSGNLNMADKAILNVNYIDFDKVNGISQQEARAVWNDTEGCLNIGMKGGVVNLQVGLESLIQGQNTTGTDIINGVPIRITGAHASGRPTFGLSDANDPAAAGSIGLATEDILTSGSPFGYATTFGLVRDFNTNTWTVGDRLYVGNTPGSLVNAPPSSDERKIFMGVVLKKSPTEGIALISPVNVSYLRELSGNQFTTEVANNIIQYNGTIWENTTPDTLGGTINHHSLLGLLDDDHTQYLLVNGTRALSGNWSLGGFNLTEAKDITGTGVFTLTSSGRISIVSAAAEGAIVARNDEADAINGFSTNAVGVVGNSSAGNGVNGISSGSIGVFGQSTSWYGVLGKSTSNIGVRGESTTSYAGLFTRNTTLETSPVFQIDQVNAGDTEDILMLTHNSSPVFSVEYNGVVNCGDINCGEIVATDIEANFIDSVIFTDAVMTITLGNFTGVGNITGSDIDISAGTGDYTSTGSITLSGLDDLLDLSAMTVTNSFQTILKLSNCLMDSNLQVGGLYEGFVARSAGTQGWLSLCGETPTSSAIRIGNNGNSVAQFVIRANGQLEWGTGSAGGDVKLYRSAANTLKTDDNFISALKITGSELQIDNININGNTILTSGGGLSIVPAGDLSVDVGSNSINLIAGTVINLDSDVIIKNGKEFRFNDAGDSNYVGFKAPALTANQIWTLPIIDGTANNIIKTDGNGILSFVTPTVDIPIVLTEYDPKPARDSESNIHGALLLLTAGTINSPTNVQLGPATPANDISVTKGIGKVLVVVVGGSDVDGTITVTGESIDRDTGVSTPGHTNTIIVDAVTTDNSSDDSNGNRKHAFVGAYITDDWFTGTVVLSTSTLNCTIHVYHISFEQFNDQPSIILNTFDINILTTSVNAEFDAYLFDLNATTGNKADVELHGELHIGADGETAIADKYWRLRKGNIDQSLNGTTDGVWVDMHYSNPALVEDVTMKVWATCSQTLTLN